MKNSIIQAVRFFIIGIISMSLHFCVFSILIHLDMPPLSANVISFIVAFQMSFWGHFLWSFYQNGVSRSTAVLRFFLVAIGSFVVNELMMASLLRWTTFDPQKSLIIVLFTVAGGTFLLSKFWAFSTKDAECIV